MVRMDEAISDDGSNPIQGQADTFDLEVMKSQTQHNGDKRGLGSHLGHLGQL
jgi:hypothetical protein